MDVEYRRDFQNSYLVLQMEEDMVNTYVHRMITENRISGLLPCSCRRMNGDVLLYYDITSKISLAERCQCRKMAGEDFLTLISTLIKVLTEMEEYLLDGNTLCLDMQYIYLDIEMQSINFCCVPGESWNLENSFRKLMENLLPCIDHQNQRGVLAGYGFYQYAVKETFSLDGLRQQLEIFRKKEKKDEPQQEEECLIDYKEENIQTYFMENEEGEEKDNRSQPVLVTLGTVGIFVFGVIGWYLWRNYVTYFWIWGIIGGVFLITVSVIAICGMKRKHKSEKEKRQQKENTKTGSVHEKQRENVEISQGRIWEQREDRQERTEMKKWQDVNQTQILNMQQENIFYILEQKYPVNGQCIQLKNSGVYFIGKLKDMVDIVLPSGAVSRIHAKIRMEGNRVFLQDLNSKNGTWVNGKEIHGEHEVELKEGAEIRFADVVCVLKRI